MSEIKPVLRAAVASDCELIASWLNDPRIHKLLSSNLRDGNVDASALALGLRRRDQVWMLIQPDEKSEPCGLIALDSIDNHDGIANIWFIMGESGFQKKGIMSAAIDRFCNENTAGLHVITAWVVEGNDASVACLERSGFNQIGRIPEGVRLGDKRYDRILLQRVVGSR